MPDSFSNGHSPEVVACRSKEQVRQQLVRRVRYPPPASLASASPLQQRCMLPLSTAPENDSVLPKRHNRNGMTGKKPRETEATSMHCKRHIGRVANFAR
jgi:hypothetical protein